MKIHQYKEMMRYLTRKPVTSQDVELATDGVVTREGFMAGSPEQIEKLAKQKKLATWKQYKPKNQKTGKPYTFKEWSNLNRHQRFVLLEKIRNPEEYEKTKSKKNRQQYLKKREERIEYQKEYYEKNKEKIIQQKYAKEKSSDPLLSSKAVLREERNRLLSYMEKAARENPNFEIILENGKFIGVRDVKADQIYTHAAYKGPTGISITQHPDYEETKYFIQQAKKFKFDKPEKLLGSYFSSYETMPTYNEIYNFFYKSPNSSANELTRNSLELHHVALMKNEPTKGIQLNLAEKNSAANKIISDFTKEGSELYQNVELANERAKKLGIRLKLPDTETFVGPPERTPGQSIGVAKREVVKKFKDALEKNPELVDEIAKRFNLKTLFNDPLGVGSFLETTAGQTLSKSAPNLLKTTAKLSAVTGTPINALLGVALYSDEFKEKGLSDLETIAAGAYKGSTQDLLNFGDLIFRKLPVATYEKFVEDKPFLELLLNKPEYFEFADKQIDKYASEKSLRDRIRNRAEYEVRKSFPPTISETEIPVTATTKEYENLIKSKEDEILNANPDLKNLYEQETTIIPEPKTVPSQNLMLGPIVFPKYTQEELNFARGGRVKFAEGSDNPESDLYIPPLAKGDLSIREGVLNLAFGGRVGFSSGGIKLARLISEALLDLKNNITMVSNTARFKGAKEAKLEALTPYINVPNESRHTSILKSIEKAKENLPKEYQSILDDIKKDVDSFDYTTADVRIKALDKEVSPTIRFEGLSKDLFPMEDPLNNAIIILDPNRDRMIGRFVNRVRVDTKTGRGIRETYDTFDSESRKFLDEKDWKLMGVESLEKGKEGLN
jgi:hypothetical protein